MRKEPRSRVMAGEGSPRRPRGGRACRKKRESQPRASDGEKLKTSISSELEWGVDIDGTVVITVKVEANGGRGGSSAATVTQVLQFLSRQPVQLRKSDCAAKTEVLIVPSYL